MEHHLPRQAVSLAIDARYIGSVGALEPVFTGELSVMKAKKPQDGLWVIYLFSFYL